MIDLKRYKDKVRRCFHRRIEIDIIIDREEWYIGRERRIVNKEREEWYIEEVEWYIGKENNNRKKN